MVGFAVGFICGYIFMTICQCILEKDYERDGIAKINCKYYKLTPINKE